MSGFLAHPVHVTAWLYLRVNSNEIYTQKVSNSVGEKRS